MRLCIYQIQKDAWFVRVYFFCFYYFRLCDPHQSISKYCLLQGIKICFFSRRVVLSPKRAKSHFLSLRPKWKWKKTHKCFRTTKKQICAFSDDSAKKSEVRVENLRIDGIFHIPSTLANILTQNKWKQSEVQQKLKWNDQMSLHNNIFRIRVFTKASKPKDIITINIDF